MHRYKRTMLITAVMFMLFSGFSGCSGSSSSGDSSANGKDGKAMVTFSLKDAPENSYKAVYVSVASVEVQKGGLNGA